MIVRACRICGKSPIAEVFRLGNMPPVNYFPTEKELFKMRKYPLTLCMCDSCGLVQLNYVIPPSKMFRDYHYLTSASKPLISHFHTAAKEYIQRQFVSKGDKALDIGSNDGTLLLELVKHGIRTTGIDPSVNAVLAAKKVGIEVMPGYFNEKTAKSILKKYGQFNIITANNVFAHVHNIKEFLNGVKNLLSSDGVFIAEFAHLLEILVKRHFDTIYHEHISYFSLPPLIQLFDEFDLEIFDAKKILTQGGSLRIYVKRKTKPSKGISERLETILQEEKENRITSIATLRRFAQEAYQFRIDLGNLISDIKRQGKKIVGFGAPAKAVILLEFCRFDSSQIDYIVDSTSLKQGRFFPVGHIPVYSEKKLESDKFDYVFLLAWNFQEEIMKKLNDLRNKGARFKVIIPFPKLIVI